MADIDPTLLEILACPRDKGPLLLVEPDGTAAGAADGAAILYNPRLRLAYRIDDGIPVLLVDEAREVDGAEHDAILARNGGPQGA